MASDDEYAERAHAAASSDERIKQVAFALDRVINEFSVKQMDGLSIIRALAGLLGMRIADLPKAYREKALNAALGEARSAIEATELLGLDGRSRVVDNQGRDVGPDGKPLEPAN